MRKATKKKTIKAVNPSVDASGTLIVQSEAPRLGRPPFIACRVLIPNLWTSKGKFLKGEEVSLPASEAVEMDAADKVKLV